MDKTLKDLHDRLLADPACVVDGALDPTLIAFAEIADAVAVVPGSVPSWFDGVLHRPLTDLLRAGCVGVVDLFDNAADTRLLYAERLLSVLEAIGFVVPCKVPSTHHCFVHHKTGAADPGLLDGRAVAISIELRSDKDALVEKYGDVAFDSAEQAEVDFHGTVTGAATPVMSNLGASEVTGLPFGIGVGPRPVQQAQPAERDVVDLFGMEPAPKISRGWGKHFMSQQVALIGLGETLLGTGVLIDIDEDDVTLLIEDRVRVYDHAKVFAIELSREDHDAALVSLVYGAPAS